MTVSSQMLNGGEGSVLLVVAAPAEWRAVVEGVMSTGPEATQTGGVAAEIGLWEEIELRPGVWVVRSGVGKANAAGATAAALERRRPDVVVSLGLAGSLPGPNRAALGSVIAANRCVMGDEGVLGPDNFQSMASLGFPTGVDGDSYEVPESLVSAWGSVADSVGGVATVSSCSGSDAQAAAISSRTNASVEAMEGAAVALAAARLGVPACEVRVVSNTTGNRDAQVWDLDGALRVLTRVASEI